MFVALIRLSVIAAAALSPAVANAQRCGDTLYRDTTLRADVVCPLNSPFGLRIAAPNVRLDLNGYSIIVPRVHPRGPIGTICVGQSVGVDVERVHDFLIHGGRITAGGGCSDTGIRVLSSDRGRVLDVTFDTPRNTAISIQGSSETAIEGNTFASLAAVVIWGDPAKPGRPAARTEIVGNLMPTINGFQRSLVDISSNVGAIETKIAHNKVDGPWYLVRAGAGSHQLSVIGNMHRGFAPLGQQPRASIFLWDSDDATIAENWVEGTAVALSLSGRGHWVERNYLEGEQDSVQVGLWHPASGITIRDNLLSTTTGGTGLWFGVNAQSNDGRGNRFGTVSTPVFDQGTGNLY